MAKANKKNTRPGQGSKIFPVLLLLLLLGLLLPRCAQIVAPTGGPKDTLPPVLLSATPPDSTLHFNAETITFNFNEFIQLQDLQQQMIIAPNPDRRPEILAKLRTLTITWPENDTLKPNTTYIINMGNAIQDINEGNPIKGFRYVFSTGSYLDSLEIRGKVIQARTGLPDSTALVMLYTDQFDSVVTKQKPVYYTRCKGDGSFRFQNLPHDTFKVFALIDGNGDLQYGDSTEAIAFLKNPLVLNSVQSGLVLSLFKEKETVEQASATGSAPAPTGKKEKEKKKELTFRTSLSGGQQDLMQPLELVFNAPLQSLDTAAIVLQEDTTFSPVAFRFGHKDTLTSTVNLLYNWKENTPYRILIDSAFAVDTAGTAYAKKDTLRFTSKSKSDYGTLILHFDLNSLKNADSTGAVDRLQADTSALKTTDSMAVDSGRLAGDSLPPVDSAAAWAGHLQADTTALKTTDSMAVDAGRLAGDSLPPVDSAAAWADSSGKPLPGRSLSGDTTGYQLVVELYKGEEMIYSAPLKGDTWTKAYLNPGDYKVRVVKDRNLNGKWDRGCYYCEEQRQPEPVYSMPEDFTIRANWKNDFPAREVKFEESAEKE